MDILYIVENLLGKGRKQSKGEFLFFCPACHHYKPKLIVKLNPSYKMFQHWHCWVCGETNNTKGTSLFSLFRRFGASPNQLKELSGAVGSYNPSTTEEIKKILRLPKEFVSLLSDGDNSIGKRHAIVELRRRKILLEDIVRYNIGYCERGEYANRIIIPSYNENGSLNYFVARSYFTDTLLKYKNPEISKNIIVFEMFINWNLPVVICEGVMDAIAIKRNAIPLLGKNILQNLYEKLSSYKPTVIVYLDSDAIRDAIKISEKLLTKEIKVHIAVPPSGRDPGSLSFAENCDIIDNAKEVDFENLIQYKLRN